MASAPGEGGPLKRREPGPSRLGQRTANEATPIRIAFEHAQLDTEARTLEREGRRIPVERKVFDLLVYLIEHRDRVASSQELLDALWPGISVGPAALSGAVHKARLAVGDDGERQAVLRTVHGCGFQFVAEVSALPELETSPPPSHALAVLPFVNMSADPDQAYFADGIAEELLNTVARFEGLRVVGRTSSFSFRDSDTDLRAIGEVLGADLILEGSVRKAGARVRITAQLLDARDGYHLWSESYDRELGDVFAIQTEIATAIATALRAQLTSEQHQRLPRHSPAISSPCSGWRRSATSTDSPSTPR